MLGQVIGCDLCPKTERVKNGPTGKAELPNQWGALAISGIGSLHICPTCLNRFSVEGNLDGGKVYTLAEFLGNRVSRNE